MPSYIRGKYNRACCALLDVLGAMGIAATVGHTSRGKTLLVYTQKKSDIPKVPAEWNGWTLEAKHMGRPKPLVEDQP